MHDRTPAEIQELLAAERAAAPFLLLRDGDGHQLLLGLPRHGGRLVVGRGEATDVTLAWDDEASRVHAELELVGDDWTIADDGLSANGTFVNGERVHGRRRLRDGDRVQIGRSVIVYRAPLDTPDKSTVAASSLGAVPQVSDAQRRVLVALCRPYAARGAFAAPATNQEIAAELVIGIDAVKTHMRALFERLGVEDLPQNQKRARLVELALRNGVVTIGELADLAS